MHLIWPHRHDNLTDADLEDLYRYPPGRKWLVVNFVSSADGAVEYGGTAAALSTPADQRILHLGSDLADLVLVGAGTAAIEGFSGFHYDTRAATVRKRHGLTELATTAVVTTGDLPATSPVITDAEVPTIVIAPRTTATESRLAWEDAGATVLLAGNDRVDLAAAIDQLVEHGYHRIDCEGGPQLFASLLAAGVVDELRLTVSPVLVAGNAGRITRDIGIDPTRLDLQSVIAADGALLIRYRTCPPR